MLWYFWGEKLKIWMHIIFVKETTEKNYRVLDKMAELKDLELTSSHEYTKVTTSC